MIYFEVLREYLSHAVFEERDWLYELDQRTGPVQHIIRNWNGETVAIRREVIE